MIGELLMTPEDVGEQEYKRSGSRRPGGYEVIKKEMDAVKERTMSVMEKLNDPVFLAGTLYNVQRERENTNRILKELYVKLERIESAVKALEEKGAPQAAERPILSEVDEQIVAVIRRLGKACAEDVQRELRYKGRNGASARLNRLYQIGVLRKRHAGRTVYYFLRC